MVNGRRVPLDITDFKRKRKYIETIFLHIVFVLYGKKSKVNVYRNEIYIQLFYTLYLNRKEKNAK